MTWCGRNTVVNQNNRLRFKRAARLESWEERMWRHRLSPFFSSNVTIQHLVLNIQIEVQCKISLPQNEKTWREDSFSCGGKIVSHTQTPFLEVKAWTRLRPSLGIWFYWRREQEAFFRHLTNVNKSWTIYFFRIQKYTSHWLKIVINS